MTKSDGDGVRKEELYTLQRGRLESSGTKKRTTRGVGHLPPGHTPGGLKERCTHTFLLLPYSQQLKSENKPKHPVANEWLKKMWYKYAMIILLESKKKAWPLQGNGQEQCSTANL